MSLGGLSKFCFSILVQCLAFATITLSYHLYVFEISCLQMIGKRIKDWSYPFADRYRTFWARMTPRLFSLWRLDNGERHTRQVLRNALRHITLWILQAGAIALVVLSQELFDFFVHFLRFVEVHKMAATYCPHHEVWIRLRAHPSALFSGHWVKGNV